MQNAQLFEMLGHRLDECLRTHERRQTDPLEVQPGSAMAVDDALLDPYHLSHGVKEAPASALDHLVCLRALLVKAEELHMAAPYTLMRAALENASLGLWLLAPSDPVERRRRQLLLELDDAQDNAQARKLRGLPSGKSVEQRQDELFAVADRADVPRSMLPVRRPGWASKVREAGVASGVGADDLEFTWRWLSGYTHGRRWAHLAIAEREALTESADGVTTFSLTASMPALTLAVLQAGQVLDAAVSAETKARLAFRQYDRSPRA